MNKNIVLKLGNIADSVVDAIVNAGNTWLRLGGGVSGALNTQGGPQIQKQLDALRQILESKLENNGQDVIQSVLSQGQAVVTSAGNLRCKHIIHAAVVGPETVSEEILRKAIKNTLSHAEMLKCKSIAFPALGTGTGKFSIEECAEIMIDEIIKHLAGETHLLGVMFVLYSSNDFTVFEKAFKAKGIACKIIGKET